MWARRHASRAVLLALVLVALPRSAPAEGAPERLPPMLDGRSAAIGDRVAGLSVGLGYRHGDRRLFSEARRERLDLPRLVAWVELLSRLAVEADYSIQLVRYEAGIETDAKNPPEDGIGSGDVTLRLRVGVLRGGPRWPALALGSSVKLPNATDRGGLGTDETDVWLHAWVGAARGRVQVHGHLDFGILGEPTRRAAQDDVFGGGIAVQVGIGDGLAIAAEASGRLPSSANPGEATLRMAFSGPVAPALRLAWGPEVSVIERELAFGLRLEALIEGWPRRPGGG